MPHSGLKVGRAGPPGVLGAESKPNQLAPQWASDSVSPMHVAWRCLWLGTVPLATYKSPHRAGRATDREGDSGGGRKVCFLSTDYVCDPVLGPFTQIILQGKDILAE